MKRKALLIGNTSGLPGVKVDMQNYRLFLQSDTGGAWRTNEIETLVDIAKSNLLTKISIMKSQSYDYVVVLFSGHGGQIRETVLELNKDGETIGESYLRSIAQRQLNIYDCCRCYPQAVTESALIEKRFESLAKSESSYVRQRYDNRIMMAIPQQVNLYSCSVGQSSYDSKEGGIYLTNLIKAATSVIGEFKLVGIAHEETEKPTYLHSLKEKHGPQNPDAILTKCLTSQQLVISIKP